MQTDSGPVGAAHPGLSVPLSQNSADIPLTPAQSVVRYSQTGTETPLEETADMPAKTIRKPKAKSPEAQKVAETLAATLAPAECPNCGQPTCNCRLSERTMAAAAKVLPAVEEPKAKPKRSFRIVWSQGTEGAHFIVRITNGSSADYLIRAVQPGVYLLTKLEDGRETTYTVALGEDKTYTCTCEAGKHGWPCKHGDCLVALRDRGTI